MQVQVVILLAILTLVYAQVSQAPDYKDKYPDIYKYAKSARHPRNIYWDRKVNDTAFGTQAIKEDDSLNKGVIKQDIYNDESGTLKDKVYGTHEVRSIKN